MRAIIFEGKFNVGDIISITDEKHHHLKNVLRIKRNQELLILLGEGVSYLGKIDSIDKKETRVSIIKENTRADKPKHNIDLYLGLVKKDALESCLKSAVELSVRTIYLMSCENSQKYDINTSRVESIINNAIEQSNIKHFPFVKHIDFKNIDLSGITNCFIASNKQNQKGELLDIQGSIALFIGPEAGFTDNEEEILLKQADVINLPTGILRTRTAVPALLGYLHGMCHKN